MNAWKAWWSLLPNLERAHNLAEILGWVCAVGIALSLVFMWWTGEAIRHQTQSQTNELQSQLTNTQTELQGTRDELQRTRDELEQVRKPRSLTKEQRAKFISLLRSGAKGPVDVQPIAGDDEAYAFAMEILQALREAGWDAKTSAVIMRAQGARGLLIQVRDKNHVPDQANALWKALTEIGFPPTGEENLPTPDGAVTLVVGRKP